MKKFNCEKNLLSTCLQLYHLTVAIVPPVVPVRQIEKGCSSRLVLVVTYLTLHIEIMLIAELHSCMIRSKLDINNTYSAIN